MLETLEARFRAAMPAVDFCSFRFMREKAEQVAVRRGVLEPVSTSDDMGVMVTVAHDGGWGYGATSDLSEEGLKRAVQRAREWAERTQGKTVFDPAELPQAQAKGHYAGPVQNAWEDVKLIDKVDLLKRECARLKTDDAIVNWISAFSHTAGESMIVTSAGGHLTQTFSYLIPSMMVHANKGAETVRRTFGANAFGRQGGMEVLQQTGFNTAAPRIAEQALMLLAAPDCPEETTHLLLAPDQMVLQIHESIGHPIELDRILGDERNYAGTSFVTLDMFGSYQYGSELLNVSFDPTISEQMASYGYDDDGTPAVKEYVIEKGLLKRPLGGATSQVRAQPLQPGIQGVANSRACSWNRPPIDRMANLNVEPGESSVEDMVKSIERGVYMETNLSWSIDDSRNKFQFGCEYGRLIENGVLKGVVKNPNYRGVSASFWRNLAMVGDASTVQIMGTPNCGKGEPNQMVRVGHASPTCLFRDVEVFGGAK